MKRAFIFILLAGYFYAGKSQQFYDIDTIRTLDIQFTQTNWDTILDSLKTNGDGKGRLLANCTIDGHQFDSVGVRFKGNSTYDPGRKKNPWNIKLDFVKDQDYLGIQKLKLSNQHTDPSQVREAVTYEVANNYMHSPQASYIRVYVNGDYYGLFCATESINGRFNKNHYYSSGNTFFKCEPETYSLSGPDNSSLLYRGLDTNNYVPYYEMKSTNGWEHMRDLSFTLNLNSSAIATQLDVDEALWFHALSNVFVHLDGYNGLCHNYYLYRDHHGRFRTVIWDLNMSFGGFGFSGYNVFPLNTQAMQELDPMLHETNTDRPFIHYLLQNPIYRKMYVAHLRTIVQEQLSTGLYLDRAEYMHNLIDQAVFEEPNALYPYADFQDNLYNDIGSFFGLRPGIENLMDARTTYLVNHPELTAVPPIISNISYTPAKPQPGDSITITAELQNEAWAYVGWRQGPADYFKAKQMFDDGLHGDGSASDGVYGARIPAALGEVQYYVYSENSNAGVFSPVRAEHEFHTITVHGDLVINEFMASNKDYWYDNFNQDDDWIELYNNGSSPINLSGYYLTDNINSLHKWPFPDTTILANDFLIVWADNDSLQNGLHAYFKLQQNGEELYLVAPNDSIVDKVQFGFQTTNATTGRYPNGTGPFVPMPPTFSSHNSINVGVAEKENKISLKLYPNPARDYIIVEHPFEQNTLARIFNLYGQQVGTHLLSAKYTRLNIGELSSGFYFLKVNDAVAVKFVVE